MSEFEDTEENNIVEFTDEFSLGVTSDIPIDQLVSDAEEYASQSLTEKDDNEKSSKLPDPKKLGYVKGQYRDTPTINDQFKRLPETIKMGPPEAKFFDLKSTTDLQAYNELMAKTFPEEAPSIVILEMPRNTEFQTLVIFQKVNYLILT
jgi:hypothetical protein